MGINMTVDDYDYEGKSEFLPKLKAAEKVNPQNLLKWTTAYAAAVKDDCKHTWPANLLLGLATTLASIPQCKWVYCERKGPVGKSLHFDTSWSKYLILKESRERKQREAAMKPPTGPFTNEEREKYRKEIVNLQAYIIGNVTNVLTLKQVQVLAGKKVLGDLLTLSALTSHNFAALFSQMFMTLNGHRAFSVLVL